MSNKLLITDLEKIVNKNKWDHTLSLTKRFTPGEYILKVYSRSPNVKQTIIYECDVKLPDFYFRGNEDISLAKGTIVNDMSSTKRCNVKQLKEILPEEFYTIDESRAIELWNASNENDESDDEEKNAVTKKLRLDELVELVDDKQWKRTESKGKEGTGAEGMRCIESKCTEEDLIIIYTVYQGEEHFAAKSTNNDRILIVPDKRKNEESPTSTIKDALPPAFTTFTDDTESQSNSCDRIVYVEDNQTCTVTSLHGDLLRDIRMLIDKSCELLVRNSLLDKDDVAISTYTVSFVDSQFRAKASTRSGKEVIAHVNVAQGTWDVNSFSVRAGSNRINSSRLAISRDDDMSKSIYYDIMEKIGTVLQKSVNRVLDVSSDPNDVNNPIVIDFMTMYGGMGGTNRGAPSYPQMYTTGGPDMGRGFRHARFYP